MVMHYLSAGVIVLTVALVWWWCHLHFKEVRRMKEERDATLFLDGYDHSQESNLVGWYLCKKYSVPNLARTDGIILTVCEKIAAIMLEYLHKKDYIGLAAFLRSSYTNKFLKRHLDFMEDEMLIHFNCDIYSDGEIPKYEWCQVLGGYKVHLTHDVAGPTEIEVPKGVTVFQFIQAIGIYCPGALTSMVIEVDGFEGLPLRISCFRKELESPFMDRQLVHLRNGIRGRTCELKGNVVETIPISLQQIQPVIDAIEEYESDNQYW